MPQHYDGSLFNRLGYDPDFVGLRINAPTLVDESDAVLVDSSPIVKYTRFSLSLSKSRKLARWVAWNIDGSALSSDTDADALGRDGLSFKFDPRIDPNLQTPNSVYHGNDLDKGHIARRADLLWGSDGAEAQRANADSFYLTNITPQMKDFNESRLAGLWGCLENALLEQVDEDNAKVTVMGGPVLSATDEPYRDVVSVPVRFWKVLVYRRNQELRTRGFIVAQRLRGLAARRDRLDAYELYEHPLDQIASLASVRFDAVMHGAQPRGRHRTLDEPRSINDFADISW